MKVRRAAKSISLIAIVACVAGMGCSSGASSTKTLSLPAVGVMAAPGSPAAHPVPSPVVGKGPKVQLSPQAVPQGEAITKPGIPAGADPHSPATGMVN